MNIKEKYKFKKFIKDLVSIRGRHTELVTVYIPTGYDIIKIIHHLSQEQGTASNIKDKNTRNRVIDSLEKMIRHLRLFKKTPPNGLAVFSGNISKKESQTDLQVFSIEPPQPLKLRMYRCDQTFVLDPLQDMVEDSTTYGLIVIDKREATIGVLKGTSIKTLSHSTSDVPGKTRAGGQCQIFGTLVETTKGIKKIEEIQVGDILKSYNLQTLKLETSECTDKWFVKKNKIIKIQTENHEVQASTDHLFFIKGMKTKPAEELTEQDYLLDSNKKPVKIKKIETMTREEKLVDISVKNQNFIANGLIVHNSAKRYESIRKLAAIDFYKRISEKISRDFLGKKELKGILLGGPGPTKEEFRDYLNTELKNKILTSKDLSYTGEFGLRELVELCKDTLIKEEITEEKEIMETFFKLLATETNKVSYGLEETKKALELGAVKTLLISESLDDELIESLEESTSQTGSELRMITTDTTEGKQLKELGGIAAILRFPIS